MSDMFCFSKKEALRIAKYWSKILGIKNKQIEVLFGLSHPKASASICVLRNGKIIDDDKEMEKVILNDDFDTIRIVLYDMSDLNKLSKTKLPKWIEEQYFFSRILHELLHIRYPKWNEDQIADAEAGLIGILMDKLEKQARTK